ncbi:AAA family ATPase [Streptomyces sp. NBC_00075]|uniref:ATP-dependent nuclease n=1 Tax=Streptomyces sp. NBC_00075 TaxID=2975641 RepID=UPI00324C6D33
MRISKLRVQNFKSFADTGELELAGINVLVGRNNSGKSVILRSIHTMQENGHPNPEHVRIGTDAASVKFEFSGDCLGDALERHFGVSAPDAENAKLNFSFQRTDDMHNGLSLNEDRRITFGSSVAMSDGSLGRKTGNSGVRAIRSSEPSNFIYTYFSKRKVAHFERIVDLTRTLAIENDLRNLVAKVTRLANPDYEGAQEYEALCNNVLGFRISSYASAGGQQAGIPVGRFDHIPIESMGEGVSSMLGLIADLCMGDGNLFLIEEPENDIHPESLKTLLRVIVDKSKNNQFIVTTHSNIVTRYLGAAVDCKVFEVTMNHQRNTTPTSEIQEIERTAEARIEVLRSLGYELSDFDLWDGWLILEESSAELVIRYFVPWFVPRLARVRTISAGGVTKVVPTFEDFRRLFLFAHLEPQYKGRVWVIVDGDDPGKEVVSNLQGSYKTWPGGHFRTWTHGDFEHFYPSRFFEQVFEVLAKSHDEKREAKKRLTRDVRRWCDENPEAAKAAFKESAAEVIEMLQEIDKTLFGSEE